MNTKHHPQSSQSFKYSHTSNQNIIYSFLVFTNTLLLLQFWRRQTCHSTDHFTSNTSSFITMLCTRNSPLKCRPPLKIASVGPTLVYPLIPGFSVCKGTVVHQASSHTMLAQLQPKHTITAVKKQFSLFCSEVTVFFFSLLTPLAHTCE